MDSLDVRQIKPDQLHEYASIPISFEVRNYLRVIPQSGGLGGLLLVEESLTHPYQKDYDFTSGKDTGPNTWSGEFDLRNWAIFIAYINRTPAGGAAVATRTSKVNLLENRTNLAVLWDIRVHPRFRRNGIGTSLFRKAVDWSRKGGFVQMKIETQNINLPACRFYMNMGCHLGMIHRYGYAAIPEVADETMLFWYYDLSM